MTKIKQIARKLDNGFYERVSLGATNTSELINDSGFITNEDLITNQADWNENSTAAASYIKNRTHWVLNNYKEQLWWDFGELNFIKDGSDYYPSTSIDTDEFGYFEADPSAPFIVEIDEIPYYVECTYGGVGNHARLGNPVIYGTWPEEEVSENYRNMGAPFFWDGNKIWIKGEEGTHTIKIYGLSTSNIYGLSANFLENDSLKTKIQDLGFITNYVDWLANYYDCGTIDNMLNALTTLDIQVITEFPENPSSTTIYLKGSETTGTNDYEEWIYVNNDWELIGTTAVDLSNYYNKTEADEQFAKLSLYGDTTINVGRKNNTSIGEYSTAEGYQTTASGSYSHAEGNVSKALGNYSHAEGSNTTASGSYSHAEGSYTKASGNYSHAGGYHTTASSEGSYAEGYETQATGPRAHSEGDNTIASGSASHVEGYNTIASGKNQHVQGRYNLEDSNDTYAHIVGNGWSGANSNAHTLDWNGNAWFSGDVYIKSTSGTNKDEGSKRLITEEEVTNMLGSVSGDISLSDPLAYEAIV